MSLTIGAWIIPLIITVIAIGTAWFKAPVASGMDFGASAAVGLFYLLVAIIVSLFAWLVWAGFCMAWG